MAQPPPRPPIPLALRCQNELCLERGPEVASVSGVDDDQNVYHDPCCWVCGGELTIVWSP